MQRRSWPVAHCLLAGWVATQLGADLVYAVTTIRGTFEIEGPVTAALALSFVLLGAAVLHPSFGDAAVRPVDQRRIAGFRRLATVGGAALIAPSVLVVLGVQGRTDDVAMVALLSMVLLVLVLTRIGLLVVDAREHGRIQAELTHSVDEERRRAEENRDLVATLQERHALAQRLSRIQREISSRAPLQDVLDAITSGASELLDDEVVGLRLIDDDDPETMVMVSALGVADDLRQGFTACRWAPASVGRPSSRTASA
jgi:hypothetical protein